MRYFVTGGAGFIGSHYVRSLLTGSYDVEPSGVTVFDKLTYAGNLTNLDPVAGDPRFRFVRGDISDPTAVEQAMGGHDVVVNFAAETHVDRSINGGGAFVLANVLGAQVVFDVALRLGIPRLVHIGTDEVYGSIAQGSWTEASPLLPNSPYSATKASAELLARAYFVTHGLNVSTTRCSNNYGPYQYPEKVVPLFITNLLDGLRVPLYGEGENVRDWLHVDDHCRGIQLVVERGTAGESYNIGGGRELSNKELTSLLLESLGESWAAVEHVPDRLGHDLRYSVDDARLRALGYQPRWRFEDGLAATVDWYRANEAWWRPLKRT